MAEKTPATVAQQPDSQTVSTPTPTVVVQSKSSLPTIALIAILALAGGGGGAWFLQAHGHAEPAATGSVAKPTETIVHLDGFTVNLADPQENHFLRVSIELAITRMPPPSERDKPNSGLPMARIRDTILSVLTGGEADVLLTSEGKQQLKKNLLDVLNRDNPELGIREIYFTEFLVQR